MTTFTLQNKIAMNEKSFHFLVLNGKIYERLPVMHLSIVSGAAALVVSRFESIKVRALLSVNNSGVPIKSRTVPARMVTELQQT